MDNFNEKFLSSLKKENSYKRTTTGKVNAVSLENIANISFINVLGLARNPDGSYSRAGHTGIYWTQPNGTIFYSGGNGPNGSSRAQTYVNGAWDQTRNTPAAGTLPAYINALGLTRNADGSYSRAGYTGTYLAQGDGTISRPIAFRELTD